MSTKVRLAKSADWDVWFYFVRTRATITGIWELVDPDLTERPVLLEEPVEPVYVVPDDDDFHPIPYAAYEARKEIYRWKLTKYEQQVKALGDLTSFIQETIAPHNVTFIQKEEPHPWNLLRALRKHLAPSDEARSFDIEQKYHRLCRGPGTQSLDSWLDEWTVTYAQAKHHDLPLVSGSDTRPIRDFLMAIRSEQPTFADVHLALRGFKKEEDMYGLIEDFRYHICLLRLASSRSE